MNEVEPRHVIHWVICMWFPYHCTPKTFGFFKYFHKQILLHALLLPILLSLNFYMKSFNIQNSQAKRRVYRKTGLYKFTWQSWIWCSVPCRQLTTLRLPHWPLWQLWLSPATENSNSNKLNSFSTKLSDLFSSEHSPTNKRILLILNVWNPLSRLQRVTSNITNNMFLFLLPPCESTEFV